MCPLFETEDLHGPSSKTSSSISGYESSVERPMVITLHGLEKTEIFLR